jgi:ElaB/YqjD/DUF883 family membrane-anchored ribosome-binding protein
MATEIRGGNTSADMQEAISGAKDGLRTALDTGRERAAQLKDAAFDRASQFKDAAFDRGRTALSSIEQTIEERPLMVLGGVFAGGLILGLLLSRK